MPLSWRCADSVGERAIKVGQTPEDWEKKPAKNRQKDKDAPLDEERGLAGRWGPQVGQAALGLPTGHSKYRPDF